MTDTAEKLLVPNPARVTLTPCILDDSPGQLEMMSAMVTAMGYEPIATTDPNQALELVRQGRCRLVLADVHMPGMDGYAFLEQAMRCDPGANVILTTGDYTLESAVEAIRRGAYDFLPKPLDQTRLRRTLDEMAVLYDQRRRVRELEEQLLKDLEFHGIVGKSPAMLEVFDLARKVARHYTNVLLVGATGTGKELVARAIHQLSPVGQQRLAICNCSALVDTLLESQLFGHVRGAFTGATDTRQGLFEYANGGTVFLDEVSEMSLPMQAKLLRVIQNREIQSVGSPEVRQVNVRLIAATNRDLRAEVLAGRVREDLYYRVSSIQIRLPALTDRLEDIPLLVHYFLKKYNEAYGKQIAGLTRRAQTVLLQHAWRGNVRELENGHIERLHHHGGRFHRYRRSAGTSAAAGTRRFRPRILATAVARRSAAPAHSARPRDVPRKPATRRADSGYRTHQSLPLFEARRPGNPQDDEPWRSGCLKHGWRARTPQLITPCESRDSAIDQAR